MAETAKPSNGRGRGRGKKEVITSYHPHRGDLPKLVQVQGSDGVRVTHINGVQFSEFLFGDQWVQSHQLPEFLGDRYRELVLTRYNGLPGQQKAMVNQAMPEFASQVSKEKAKHVADIQKVIRPVRDYLFPRPNGA